MAIPRDVIVQLAMLDLEPELAEIIVDLLYEVEAATLADANPAEAIDARRAADRERQRRYRERQGNAETEWQSRRVAVFERDGHRCVYCGTDVKDDPQCDHRIPLVKGGSNDITNLVTACRRCNSAKAGRTVEEWGGPSWGSSPQR